jgi:hypothetical protein
VKLLTAFSAVGTFVGMQRLRVRDAMKLRVRRSRGPNRTGDEREDIVTTTEMSLFDDR